MARTIRLLNDTTTRFSMAKKTKKKAAHKHNNHKASHKAARRSGAKRNGMQRRHSYKRNGMEGGLGMRVLKAFGAVMAGAAVAIGGMLLLSATSLSAMAQDGILIAGGVVIGGALFAMGHTHVAVAVMAGPITLGLSRRVLTWGITSRAQELIASIQGPAQTPAAQTPAAQTPAAQTPAAQTPAATNPATGFYGYNPGGYLAASPDWQPGMAERSVRPDSLVNFTTPMAQYALG
jgi:hypothetical protein